MRRINRPSAVACLAGAACGYVGASVATAETCYRVTDIRALGFLPGIDDILGINSAGEAAFTAVVNGEKHAFVWLPQPNYGLAAGPHDVHVLSELGAGESAAHDINDSGFVAGGSGAPLDGGEAIVWQLASGTATACQLGRPSCPNDPDADATWAVAFAINDADPPVVIGDSDNCFDGCAFGGINHGAFRITLEGCPSLSTCSPALCTILETGNDDSSFARDVNTPQNPLADPQVVGFTDEFALYPANCSNTNCEPDKDAVRWEPGIAILDDLDPPGQDFGAECRGNNNSDQIVGSGFVEGNPCSKRAVIWEPLTVAFNLGNIMPDGQEGQQSLAEAINNPDGLGRIQVVGTNVTLDLALLWERPTPTSDWSVIDLNDFIAPCANDWEIIQGHDINDNSWIIAVADADLTGGTDFHAVLLTPLAQCPSDCEGDLDGDGVVGILDLLALLAAWGPCPDPPESCFADLDCDGEVKIFDLLILIANWGKCPGEQGPPPKSLKKELEDAGLSEDDWDLFEDCLTNGTREEQDNCRCWFDRYINGCPADCSQLPACGAVDPFNECPGDFTGALGVPDCRVDAFDLARLLSCWGSPCGDLTGDCTTDPFDQARLLANWGACPQAPLCGPGPELSCGEGAQGGSGSEDGSDSSPSLTAALAQMGFDSVAAYQAYITTASDAEAFTSVSVLQALLEAQP